MQQTLCSKRYGKTSFTNSHRCETYLISNVSKKVKLKPTVKVSTLTLNDLETLVRQKVLMKNQTDSSGTYDIAESYYCVKVLCKNNFLSLSIN